MEPFAKTNPWDKYSLTASKHVKSKIIRFLLSAMKKKNEYTANHCIRVMKLSVGYAKYYGLTGTDVMTLKHSALLHDVGKIFIPKKILDKQDFLSESEYNQIKRHPLTGYYVVKWLPFFRKEAVVIKCHHERVDGCGYPKGLHSSEICELSKIISICDAFDAMTNTRVYRKKLSYTDAIDELKRNAGTQFDSALVNKFCNYLKNRKNIQCAKTIVNPLANTKELVNLHQPDIVKIHFLKDEIENVRNKLNELIAQDSDYCLKDDIIHVSQDLDKLICSYMNVKVKD